MIKSNPKMLESIRLPWPTQWDEVFGRDAPLLMEVGFGNGQFLVELAQSRPEANVVGVEVSSPSLRRGKQRIERAGLKNVRLVQGTAQLVLQAHCAPSTVSEIIVNFPDPWPKSGHQRRRLINFEFLGLVATRMKPGGLLQIATDHADYAAAIAACLEQIRFFESPSGFPFATQDQERRPTKYERVAMSEGRTCYYFKWRRNHLSATGDYPIPEELPMPHVILQSPLSVSKIAKRFRPISFREGDVHVKLLGCYVSVGGDRLLIEAYIVESPLKQRIGLSVRQREAQELVIGLAEIGFPRSTNGIHLAIKHLAEQVVEFSPDSEWVQTNLKLAGDRQTQ